MNYRLTMSLIVLSFVACTLSNADDSPSPEVGTSALDIAAVVQKMDVRQPFHEKKSTMMSFLGQNVSKFDEIFCINSNSFIVVSTMAKNPLPEMANSRTTYVCDGNILWEIVENAPGSGKLLAERLKVKDAVRIAEEHEKMKVFKYDINMIKVKNVSSKLIIDPEASLDLHRYFDEKAVSLQNMQSGVVSVNGPCEGTFKRMMGGSLAELEINTDSTLPHISKATVKDKNDSVVYSEVIDLHEKIDDLSSTKELIAKLVPKSEGAIDKTGMILQHASGAKRN